MLTPLIKPNRYSQDKNKRLFDEFEEKIKEYNALSSDAPKNLKIALLQEIDFFVQNPLFKYRHHLFNIYIFCN